MKIKEKLKQFGILVIRAIWPSRARKSAQHLGILIVGLAVMFSVTRASVVQDVIASIIGDETTVQKQTGTAKPSSLQDGPTKVADEAVNATTEVTGNTNIVDLIADSEIIIRGAVKEVTDGFENGVPYTEVTVEVEETLRGKVGKEYTFRQFGLTQPRKMDNGKVYLGVTPDGWSKYAVGEDAMFFLYKPAAITGLRTTTGLGQGKVNFKGGNAVSQFDNQGLFENVVADVKGLNDKDKRMLATKKGAVNADGFKSFVRRAVSGKWVEGGKMRHATN